MSAVPDVMHAWAVARLKDFSVLTDARLKNGNGLSDSDSLCEP